MVSQGNRKSRRNSTTELQGLDAMPKDSLNPTTLSPVSPGSKSKVDEQAEAEVMDEVEEIERLEERVAELEKQLEREEEEGSVPIVTDVEKPSQAEVDRHEVTHTPARKWCKACQKGMAIRDKHERKKKNKTKQVKSTEVSTQGQTSTAWTT